MGLAEDRRQTALGAGIDRRYREAAGLTAGQVPGSKPMLPCGIEGRLRDYCGPGAWRCDTKFRPNERMIGKDEA